ncbi:MAG TPA: hypothetical protein VH234_00140 [Candidatus Saccharimonadales bacterium]|jgi:hypothetical protein|nr:hypothetical protein [Candidatus Saccharimonadales bacterium]
MSPNNNESLQLPTPVAEQAPETNRAGRIASVETQPKGKEQAPSPEGGSQAGAAPPPALPTIPLPVSTAMSLTGQPGDGSAASQGNPAQASDDADLIEKEWVTKAKQIVERTRNDPYKQSEELTVFKADYMKKRYNRTIKVSQ